MNLVQLIILKLKSGWALNVLFIVLCGASLTSITAVKWGIESGQAWLKSELNRCDVLVAAPGSAFQNLLANLFFLEEATGNIPASSVDSLRKHPFVKESLGLAYGDQVAQHRLLGTSPNVYEWYGIEITSGHRAQQPGDLCLPQKLEERFQLGDTLFSLHGKSDHAHEAALVVRGFFQSPSRNIDRVILTPIATIWDLHHNHSNDLTALLIRVHTPFQKLTFPQIVGNHNSVMGIFPDTTVDLVFKKFLPLTDALVYIMGFVFLIILASLLGWSTTLHLRDIRSFKQLRLMGYSKKGLFWLSWSTPLILVLTSCLIARYSGAMVFHSVFPFIPPMQSYNWNWFYLLACVLILLTLFIQLFVFFQHIYGQKKTD